MQFDNHKPLRFTRIRVENWRNFGEAEVNLQRRAFIVGPNASGKSNFLDLFRFLHDIVAVGRGFEQAVESRGGVSSLRSLVARRYSDIVITVSVGTDEWPTVWRYELGFSQDNNQRPVIKHERMLFQSEELFRRPDEPDIADPERLTQTYLQQVNVNKDYRQVADFFSTVRYLHIVPQLVREPDRSAGRKDDPFGGDFLEQIARTAERIRTSRLNRIQDALRVAVPQLESLELSRDEASGTPHLRGKYQHWRPQGAWQTEGQFSDGTLRLLGLLWATLDGLGTLLLEEPELSLHPEVIRYLPQMFARIQRRSGRQIIASTHSTDLLREGVGLNEVILLTPSQEGTTARTAGDFSEVRELLEGGINLAEIVMPRTRPEFAEQLSFFGDE
ncbi:MAG TPA: AAA family ATPase [Candidatus Acidoferrum sp.]|nr:AAA family ATPase [Candidatus Acidoferrum sp.]